MRAAGSVLRMNGKGLRYCVHANHRSLSDPLRPGKAPSSRRNDAWRRRQRAIALHTDLETALVQRIDQCSIQLQQRLSAGADDVRIAAPRPVAGDGISQRPGRCELAASRAVRADKLGIAKPANGAGAIPLAAGPEIAAREAQEHRRAPGPGALTLQREVNFPD